MNSARQQAFQRLRSPCVELSSTALKFKADQVSPKAVLLALEPVYQILQSLGRDGLLDEKLAEYAFFPLTHIFNQSRRLSSHCLELAVKCVHILVTQGWRDKLLPEMAKQLLILMGLLVSTSPSQHSEPATDELKVASFECITVLVAQSKCITINVLEVSSEKNIVDQLVYQLLESITETSSDNVQISAAQALLELIRAINDRAFLASLLPRTVSTLVKVLRPSTQARRTRKVLAAYLRLLTVVLKGVLADEMGSDLERRPDNAKGSESKENLVLDKQWRDATTPQVDLALVQVVKLRTHEGSEVGQALLDLCLMVIEDAPRTLARSLPLMVETLVFLEQSASSTTAKATLKHLMFSRPEIVEIVRAKFYNWSQALPRVMQGNDDRPKQQMLGQVATSFVALMDTSSTTEEAPSMLASVLVEAVAAAIEAGNIKHKLVDEAPQLATTDLVQQNLRVKEDFNPVILNHQSQQASLKELKSFVELLRSHSLGQALTRCMLDRTQDPNASRKLSATYLALSLLRSHGDEFISVDDMIADASVSDLSLSRPFLVADSYALTLPCLLQYSDSRSEDRSDWRLVAMSLESLILQANQLGQSYRPELMETLFPMLTLLGSRNGMLQRHAMTALNLLSKACEYGSVAQMLIENADYLINGIATRLNAFDVSRDGLQVLAMMIDLCGAGLIPYLDDLIGSIFGALDSFHGYPQLVEDLFGMLKLMVDKTSEKPEVLAINSATATSEYTRKQVVVSTVEVIFEDLRTRRRRKDSSDEQPEETTPTPYRPWTKAIDDSDKRPEQDSDGEDDVNEDVSTTADQNKEPPLSKSHQLLLNIARSTVPHFSSPSPKVRLTLLALLREICPLLAQHENSFLPLVNSIWPAIVSRLMLWKEDTSSEMPYNAQAAVETMTIICSSAGDFMSSRIEEVFSDLVAIFTKVSSAVVPSAKPPKSLKLQNGVRLESVVDERRNIVHADNGEPEEKSVSVLLQGAVTRPASMQILHSVISLFVVILQNVRLTQDSADRIFDILVPFTGLPGNKEAIREILLEYNADALWLIEQHSDG